MSKKDLNQKQNVRFVVEEIEYTLDRVQGGTIFLGVISKFHWFFRVHWQSCRLHVLPGPHPEASWVRCLCISRIPLVLRTSSFSSWAPLLCDSITGATSVCVCVCVSECLSDRPWSLHYCISWFCGSLCSFLYTRRRHKQGKLLRERLLAMGGRGRGRTLDE